LVLFALGCKHQEEGFFFVDLVLVVDAEDDVVWLPQMALKRRPYVVDLP
jgi:hypothetical protein